MNPGDQSLKSEAIKLLVAQAAKLVESKPQECWALCEKIRRMDPDSIDAYFYGGQALFYMGKFQESREHLLGAPEGPRNDPLTIWSLACTEVALGLMAAATANAMRAIRRDPKLKQRMLEDMDLKPIWGRIREAGAEEPAKEEGHTFKTPKPVAPKAEPASPSPKRTRRIDQLNEELAKLKAIRTTAANNTGAMCYMPARRPPEPEPAWAEGGTLTYLCPNCTRRTQYSIGRGPFREGPHGSAGITPEDARIILENVYPNRRALRAMPSNLTVDETDFCLFCAGGRQRNPGIRINHKCPGCQEISVYHLAKQPSHSGAGSLDSVLSVDDFQRSFVELGKLTSVLGSLGKEFQLCREHYCQACSPGTPKTIIRWEPEPGEPIMLRVASKDMDLLKKFVESLGKRKEREWWLGEAEILAKMFEPTLGEHE